MIPALSLAAVALAGVLVGLRFERVALDRRLQAARAAATYDGETGLPSAAVLRERLDAELRRARRRDHGVRVLVLRPISGSLQELAQATERACAFPAQPGRLPGDRIAVILPESAASEAHRSALLALAATRPPVARIASDLACDPAHDDADTLVARLTADAHR